MSKISEEQENLANKEVYRTPQLRELGSVSELTLTSSPPPFSGSDGGSFPNNYAS